MNRPPPVDSSDKPCARVPPSIRLIGFGVISSHAVELTSVHGCSRMRCRSGFLRLARSSGLRCLGQGHEMNFAAVDQVLSRMLERRIYRALDRRAYTYRQETPSTKM
jgi:hypothetical protein